MAPRSDCKLVQAGETSRLASLGHSQHWHIAHMAMSTRANICNDIDDVSHLLWKTSAWRSVINDKHVKQYEHQEGDLHGTCPMAVTTSAAMDVYAQLPRLACTESQVTGVVYLCC